MIPHNATKFIISASQGFVNTSFGHFFFLCKEPKSPCFMRFLLMISGKTHIGFSALIRQKERAHFHAPDSWQSET